MKITLTFICAAFFLVSCTDKTVITKMYADSLINNYTLPAMVADNNADMSFWKNRINTHNPQNTNEAKYASTLITRFHQFGNINDVKKADSIYNKISYLYLHKLASPYSAMVSTAMLQHHFSEAGLLLDSAVKIGMESYNRNTLSFDVYFELGHYREAEYYLRKLKPFKDYNYYFRLAKYEHLDGRPDSSLAAMQKAASLARVPYLKGLALSNLGDLYVHIGEMQKAGLAYRECIRLNSADFHSILALGWITLVYDKNVKQAQKIFNFVLSKNQLPDPLFKMYQAAQQSGNKVLEKKYAKLFALEAGSPIYGRMYNKYLIELFTGILNDPVRAERIARDELSNRTTPQTYSWLAYALYHNHKKNEAYQIYEHQVSGFPLEGLELYYMGTMLQGLGKTYDANKFLDAASKNSYDLSPAISAALADKSDI